MSNLDRRKFIGVASAVAVAGLGAEAVLGQKVRPGQGTAAVGADALAGLRMDQFLAYVNTDFKFGQGANAVTLRLADLEDMRPLNGRARKLGQESFVLKFTGPGRAPLTQGTYEVEHFNLGTFQLFITEGGKVGRLNTYFAVINRVTVTE